MNKQTDRTQNGNDPSAVCDTVKGLKSYEGKGGYRPPSYGKKGKGKKSSSGRKNKKKGGGYGGNPYGGGRRGYKGRKGRRRDDRRRLARDTRDGYQPSPVSLRDTKKHRRSLLKSESTISRSQSRDVNDYGDEMAMVSVSGSHQHQRKLLHSYRTYQQQADPDAGIIGWGANEENGFGAYRFLVAFKLEYFLQCTLKTVDYYNDWYGSDLRVDVLTATEDSVTLTHYFPRFDELRYSGACLYYEPAWDYYAALEDNDDSSLQRAIAPNAYQGAGNAAGYNGEDANSNQLKTEPVEEENGFFSDLYNMMDWTYWVITIAATIVFMVLCCCACAFICYKRRQNTHEKNSFVALD